MSCFFQQYRPLILSLFCGIILTLFTQGCKETLSGVQRENLPPKTYLWTDTVGVVQTSRVRFFWWGNDPDGIVQGYLVTLDGTQWTWTTSQESTFTVHLGGVETLLAQFRVAAVDMEGNGRRDASVSAGGINFGPEPFDDLDSNGVYSTGEPFVDFGAIDPDPPRLQVLIKNSAPTVSFVNNTGIPAQTLPVATFLFQGTDVDGNETIVRYFIALNDTSEASWTEIPGTVSMVTLSGDLSNSSATTVSAKVFAGTGLTDLGLTVSGLRLDAPNVLYLFCEDLAGARSKVTRMPDTTRTWLVKKPVGRRNLLLVDDYATASPNPDDVYRVALQSAVDGSGQSFGDYDVLDLRTYPLPAPIHKPMLVQTFRAYKTVFWYARIADLNFAQNSLPEFMATGGKVLMTTGFQNFVDPLGLPLDFAPLDNLITSYVDSAGNSVSGFISRVYLNGKVLSEDSSSYPPMVFDRDALFGTYAVIPAPGHQVVYKLDLPKNPPNTQERWVGTPAVGVRSQDGRIFFFTMPLHLLNTVDPIDNRSRLVKFFESVLR
ncbi:MAG: hypothetical protein ACRDGA_00735, partial [Bacteroidota bacterium]